LDTDANDVIMIACIFPAAFWLRLLEQILQIIKWNISTLFSYYFFISIISL